jgi:mRNA interferase ChpB
MKRGDIYSASLDPVVGHEQRGYRPLLIISTEAFNQTTRLPVVLPITTGGNFARRLGYAVSLQGSGLKTTGIVRCDQPRVVDLMERRAKFLETLEGPLLEEILDRVADLFN